MRFVVVVILALSIGVAVFANGRYLERRMLRANPNALVQDANLARFAARRGRQLFVAHCAVCHGISGAGAATQGVPDLTDREWLHGNGQVSDIERIVAYGIRSHNPKGQSLAIMPAYGRSQPNPADKSIQPLSPGQISDLIEFIFREQGRKSEPFAATRGAALFAGNAGCYDCHSLDAKGDSAIGAPNLVDATTLYGTGAREDLFTSIAYGRQGSCPAWIRQIDSAGIRELALYVYLISHGENFDHL
jgi:cytochrome c oxidase cbb3-type subunit III